MYSLRAKIEAETEGKSKCITSVTKEKCSVISEVRTRLEQSLTDSATDKNRDQKSLRLSDPSTSQDDRILGSVAAYYFMDIFFSRSAQRFHHSNNTATGFAHIWGANPCA